MTLPRALNDREDQKFLETGSNEVAVRVSIAESLATLGVSGSLTASESPLTGSEVFTEVAISATGWTALPSSPLSSRQVLAVQNFSGIEVKLNSDNSATGYVGAVLPDQFERVYNIDDTIVIYAKATSGTPTLYVEELA